MESTGLGLAPGKYRTFSLDAVESRKQLAVMSTHEGNVLRVLELARQTVTPIPRLVIMGLPPQLLAPGLGLSPEREARLGGCAADPRPGADSLPALR